MRKSGYKTARLSNLVKLFALLSDFTCTIIVTISAALGKEHRYCNHWLRAMSPVV